MSIQRFVPAMGALCIVLVGCLGLSATLFGQSGACEMQKKITSYTATALTIGLNCAGGDIVHQDLDKMISRLPFLPCSKRDLSDIDISLDLCKVVAKYVTKKVENSIPEAWECNPQLAMQLVEKAVKAGCGAVL